MLNIKVSECQTSEKYKEISAFNFISIEKQESCGTYLNIKKFTVVLKQEMCQNSKIYKLSGWVLERFLPLEARNLVEQSSTTFSVKRDRP